MMWFRSITWRRSWVIGWTAVLAVVGSGVGVALASIPNGPGVFTGCVGTKTATVELPNPVRVLDTRTGNAGPRGPVTGTITVPVTAAVPAGAVEVLGNLTATQEQGLGYFTTWASGARPPTSSLNYVKGVDINSAVQIPLAADGTFQLYSLRTSHAVFDVTGYVQTVPGAVHLIDTSAGQSCAAGETQAMWNQQGQTGPAGSQGATGAIGPQGATGAQGPKGTDGKDGAVGPQGPAGPANVITSGRRDVSTGTTTVLADSHGMTLAAVCTTAGVTMEMYPTTSTDSPIALWADSHDGGHVHPSSMASSSPAIMETSPGDRGDFNAYSQAFHTMDGSYYVFASGSGCQFEASVAVS